MNPKKFDLHWCVLLLLGFALTLTGYSQTPAPPAGPTTAAQANAITGRVVDAEGQPLSDVAVMLYPRSSGAMRSTISDDEGKFSFPELTASQYSLYARAPGYVQQSATANAPRPGDNVTLTLVKGGVITGRVVNALGEPVVAVRVSAQRVRDEAGRPRVADGNQYAQQTDDRGVYRLYGMAAGVYLVVANAPESYNDPRSAYQRETPTYHPSADRAGADELTVRLGEEVSGIDIRYRGERGYTLSGKVTGATEAANPGQSGINVALKPVGSEISYNTAPLRATGAEVEFSFDAVPEGEYELIAQRYENPLGPLAQSTPRRVQIKSADVGGVTLTLVPLGSLTGRVVAESLPPALQCTPAKPLALEQVSLLLRRMEKASAASRPTGNLFLNSRLNAQGEFVVRGVAAGAYYPTLSLTDGFWYLRAFTTQPAPAARAADLSRAGLTFKPGENLTGITVALAPGAASLFGRVVQAEGQPLPELLRVFLLPAEAGAADALLRYAELMVNTALNKEARFGFSRLAPGRYRLYAEAVAATEPAERRAWQAAWDQTERARLRRLAAAQPEIELKACERLANQELRLK
jgi:hypothetical protein